MTFWERVDRSAGEDGCWPFLGARTAKGYGSIRVGKKTARAHRVAFELSRGRAPTGLVLHGCDNPACCNPKHLREGSNADNMADMQERGRRKGRCLGTDNGRAKRNVESARAICARHAQGEGVRALARAFGVAPPQVRKVLRGERWGSA